MQSLSRYNKGTEYLLCAFDLFSKYTWVIPIKDKKSTSIVNAFKKIISERRKPNKIWVDQGSEFYNKSFTDFLKMNNIEMYSTFNEGKSVTAERFIRTLKNKIYRHMTAVSKNVYVFKCLCDVLDDIIFAKGYAPNWSEEVFVINKINNTVPWTYAISDLNGEEITGSFYEKELQSTNQQKFRIDKIIKRKGDKLYVKWKGYNDSFNSWINKNDIL